MTLTRDAQLMILANLPDTLVVIDSVGSIVWLNNGATETYGYPADAWIGRNMLELLHPSDAELAVSAVGSMNDRDDTGHGVLMSVQVRHHDQRWVRSEVRGRSFDLDGESLIILLVRDVSDRHRLTLAHGNVDLLRSMVHHSDSILMHLDEDFRLTTSSAAMTRLLGYDGYLSEGMPFLDLVSEASRPTVEHLLDGLDGVLTFDAAFAHKHGPDVQLHVTLHDLRADKTVDGFVLTASDITDLRQVQNALRQMADTDSLTGLLNRSALVGRMERCFDEYQSRQLAVLFCDLDGFKAVNDSLGHSTGDLVLQEVAARLQRCVHADDLLGRIGGDEFVIVLTEPSIVGPKSVCQRINDAFEVPFLPNGKVVRLGVSIGTAWSEAHTNVASLLNAADQAMYQAKQASAKATNRRR